MMTIRQKHFWKVDMTEKEDNHTNAFSALRESSIPNDNMNAQMEPKDVKSS